MYRSAASAVFALIVVACSRVAEAPSASSAPPDEVQKVETSEAPPRPAPVQRGSDEWCPSSFCGCWEAATYNYRIELRDAAGGSAAGVDAICYGEQTPVARSDAGGVLAFQIATQHSPGCGYERCRNMVLRDPQGRFAERPVTSGTTGVVTLEAANSP